MSVSTFVFCKHKLLLTDNIHVLDLMHNHSVPLSGHKVCSSKNTQTCSGTHINFKPICIEGKAAGTWRWILIYECQEILPIGLNSGEWRRSLLFEIKAKERRNTPTWLPHKFVFLETENVITLQLFPKKIKVIARFAEQGLAGIA